MTGAAVVASASDQLEPRVVASGRAWWDAATNATDQTAAAREAADRHLAAALGDTDCFAEVRRLRTSEADPIVRRQLDVLHDQMLRHQIDANLRDEIVGLEVELNTSFARHRGTVPGDLSGAEARREVDDSEIGSILRTSDDDAERRAAWEASKSVGPVVAPTLRRLAHLRNRAARSLGFRDFVHLALAGTELSEPRLLETLETVADATAAPFAVWKAKLDAALAARFGGSPSDLMPWHYDNPFFQEQVLPSDRLHERLNGSQPVDRDRVTDLDAAFNGRDLIEPTIATYAAIGLSVRDIVDRSDLFPRPAKNQHAFCADIDRRGDVRVLANIASTESQMSTMLHEFGHGIYFQEVDAALPFLLRDMHMLTTEAIAMLFGRLSKDPEWLAQTLGIEADAQALRVARAGQLLLFARWTLVMTHFERALYSNPDADLDRAWWELVARYQLVHPPSGRSAPDWAAKIHLAIAPVYYHNYLYGEMLASQLRATLERRGGLVGNPDAGPFLCNEIFRLGHRHRWDHLVEAVTGEPLRIEYLLADATVPA